MLSWLPWKKKPSAAWAEQPPGPAPLPTLRNELAAAHAEMRKLKDDCHRLETEKLAVMQERDHLKSTLWNAHQAALRVKTGKSAPLEHWEPSPENLPSRAHFQDVLVHSTIKLAGINLQLSSQLTLLKEQEGQLAKEVQQLRAQLLQSENERRRLEGEVAYSLGELGLARDAQHLAERKTEFLYDELSKLSPHFKNLNAEKVAAKAAKDALKAATTPAKAPVIDPPTGPEVWPSKPKP